MFLDVRDLTITLKTGEEIAKDISFSIDGGEMLRSSLLSTLTWVLKTAKHTSQLYTTKTARETHGKVL